IRWSNLQVASGRVSPRTQDYCLRRTVVLKLGRPEPFLGNECALLIALPEEFPFTHAFSRYHAIPSGLRFRSILVGKLKHHVGWNRFPIRKVGAIHHRNL